MSRDMIAYSPQDFLRRQTVRRDGVIEDPHALAWLELVRRSRGHALHDKPGHQRRSAIVGTGNESGAKVGLAGRARDYGKLNSVVRRDNAQKVNGVSELDDDSADVSFKLSFRVAIEAFVPAEWIER